MPDTGPAPIEAELVSGLAEIDRDVWDGLALPADRPYFPFASYDFLEALEASGSIRPEVGWAPRHLLIKRNEQVIGAMPLYLKGHSRGEFVFDQAWADAYERAGGSYYPKLLSMIPFTPATGTRLHCRTAEDRALLASAAQQVAEQLGVSSLHINFPPEEEADALHAEGYLLRTGQQFRFEDHGYGDWNGFLGALASRKRKALRKERDAILNAGLEIDWITGSDITEDVLDSFWVFYQNTGARKWGTPYLTRTFFSLIAERMPDKLLFVIARRGDQPIAGAMNFIGGDTLFGRYWGCTEHIPFLHFELCYYQAIDFALQQGLRYVDAGAQGEHKIARGYAPVATYSAHWLRDPGFASAVERYLEAERAQVTEDIDFLSDFTPFKKNR